MPAWNIAVGGSPTALNQQVCTGPPPPPRTHYWVEDPNDAAVAFTDDSAACQSRPGLRHLTFDECKNLVSSGEIDQISDLSPKQASGGQWSLPHYAESIHQTQYYMKACKLHSSDRDVIVSWSGFTGSTVRGSQYFTPHTQICCSTAPILLSVTPRQSMAGRVSYECCYRQRTQHLSHRLC